MHVIPMASSNFDSSYCQIFQVRQGKFFLPYLGKCLGVALLGLKGTNEISNSQVAYTSVVYLCETSHLSCHSRKEEEKGLVGCGAGGARRKSLFCHGTSLAL